MTGTLTARSLVTALFLGVGLPAASAPADSGSVGVSVTFQVAPADLIRHRNIAPALIRSCTVLKSRLDAIWAEKERGPTLSCGSHRAMPLVASADTAGVLVVRP